MDEIVFRQREEGGRLSRDFAADFCLCDAAHRLSVCEMLRAATNLAVEHWRLRGLSWGALRSLGVAVLASRQSFKIRRLPSADEIFTCATWEEPPLPVQLARSYEMRGADGSLLAEGVSTWIIVDLKTRRIIRPADFKERPQDFAESTRSLEIPGKIALPDGMREICGRKIVFSDLDRNGHVNNARYAAFAFDALGELDGSLCGRDVAQFRLNHAREASPGEILKIKCAIFDGGNAAVVAGFQGGQSRFECEIRWRAQATCGREDGRCGRL